MGGLAIQYARIRETKRNSPLLTQKTKSSQQIKTPADRILFLQRNIGNQAVQRLIKSGTLQAKLKIGQPGDKYEQEADRVSEQVMRMPEQRLQRQVEPDEEEEEETLQTKPLAAQITPLIQRQIEPEEEEEEEELIQAKETSGQTPHVSPIVQTQVHSLRGGGQRLSPSLRNFFEPHFGHDFSRVRVHSTGPGMIQTKLKVNKPGDPYEQEADRVADVVMRMEEPRPSSSVGGSLPANSTIPRGGTIQRVCASRSEAYKTAEDENRSVESQEQALIQTKQITPLIQRQECPREEEEELIQAKITGGVTPKVTSAISSSIQSLHGGGRPLSGSERSFFEPRFGADFSNVRVHNDTKAASVARSVNARAFTLGHNVVFGAGENSSDTLAGRKLLAHELTHVMQQGKAGPQIQRWAISGNTATSDSSTDILWDLARDVGTSGNDWLCIVPVSMRTARMSTPPANFNDHYERYVQIGDRFDVSNLRKRRGTALLVHLFTNARDIGIATQFYPGITASSGDVDIDILNAANDGRTPIRSMIIFGHSTGTSMFGGVGTFDPSTLTLEPHSFALAQINLLPRRCWFTRNARVRAVGCSSTDFAREFSRAYLRRGSAIRSTTEAVAPCCHGVWDRLAFTSSSVAGSTILDGPFRSARAFHRGRFWARLRGRL